MSVCCLYRPVWGTLLKQPGQTKVHTETPALFARLLTLGTLLSTWKCFCLFVLGKLPSIHQDPARTSPSLNGVGTSHSHRVPTSSLGTGAVLGAGEGHRVGSEEPPEPLCAPRTSRVTPTPVLSLSAPAPVKRKPSPSPSSGTEYCLPRGLHLLMF